MAKVRRPSVQVNVATNGKARVNVIVSVHEHERKLLRFGHGNAKLDPAVFHFLAACWTFLPVRQRVPEQVEPSHWPHQGRPEHGISLLRRKQRSASP